MGDEAEARLTRPVLCVVGARPNFMKIAPILRAFAAAEPPIPALLVHTGQHYDAAMSDQLFSDLCLRAPDLNLGVGSSSHAVQTADVMRRFEPVLDEHPPSCVLVVGDVNSTLACSLVAVKKGVPLVHVEAGLRSFDRRMPEEINRVLTDQVADVLYTSERAAHANLAREGIMPERIRFVGNVMIDALLAFRPLAVPPEATMRRCGQDPAIVGHGRGYAVLTLHRPSNVDDPAVLRQLLRVFSEIGRRLPVLFAVHPRTRAAIDQLGMSSALADTGVVLLPPQSYLAMLGLMMHATLVLTDSGGIQEETTALGIPCLTLRENTERPITVDQGTNELVGRDPDAIISAVDDVLSGGGKRGRMPEGWDGRASERIAADLIDFLSRRAGIGAPL